MAKEVILLATLVSMIDGEKHTFKPASDNKIKTSAVIPDELYDEVKSYRPKVVEFVRDIADQLPPMQQPPTTQQLPPMQQPQHPTTSAINTEEVLEDLQAVDGIGRSIAEKLLAIGITSVEQLSRTDREILIDVKGITEKTLTAILQDIEENFTTEEE